MTDQAAADAAVASGPRVEAELPPDFQGGNVVDRDGRGEILPARKAKVGQAHTEIFALLQFILGIEIAVRRRQFQLRFVSVQTQVAVSFGQKRACSRQPVHQSRSKARRVPNGSLGRSVKG